MEVSGRKSSVKSDTFCQPCKSDGNTVKAKGYCEDCNEFICKSCIKAHKKLSWTKNHVIKPKNKIPAFLTQSSPCTEHCDVHEKEIVKFYCQEHDTVGCKSCMELHHANCNVQLVAYVSPNYGASNEFADIKHRLDCMRKNLSSSKEKIKYSLTTVEEIKNEVSREVKQFRKEVEDYLDKVEAYLIQEVEEMTANIASTQQELQNQCEALNDNIEAFQSKLDLYKDNINDLFVASKLILGRLQECQDEDDDISLKSQIRILKFIPSDDVKQMVLHNACLGKLTTENEHCINNMKTSFVGQMKVQAEDEGDCYIVGMSNISETEILCADSKNESLKIINLMDGNITSILKTSSFPADVTTINTLCSATTLPNEGKILFLNTQHGLTISHSLNVREGCWGTDYYNGKMAVSFVKPSAVQVLDMEGHILHELVDTSILTRPARLALSNKSIFITDSFNDAVYEFTLNGQLKTTIKSSDMKLPAGITYTSCGSVVVCYSKEKTKVGIIVPGTTEILPFKLQHAIMPYSVLICQENKKMYIGELDISQDCNLIKLYDLK